MYYIKIRVYRRINILGQILKFDKLLNTILSKLTKKIIFCTPFFKYFFSKHFIEIERLELNQ